MKKNTLIQNLGFANIDCKNELHDAAAHFVKQPDILKSILESLKINYPCFVDNELKGLGYELKISFLQTPVISNIKNIQLEIPINFFFTLKK